MRIDDWPPESEAAWVSRRKLLMLASSALIVLPSACNRPSDSTDSLYPKAIEHNSGEMIYWSATAIARAILEKRISSEEVVKAYLARIQAVNPKINAVVAVACGGCTGRCRAGGRFSGAWGGQRFSPRRADND